MKRHHRYYHAGAPRKFSGGSETLPGVIKSVFLRSVDPSPVPRKSPSLRMVDTVITPGLGKSPKPTRAWIRPEENQFETFDLAVFMGLGF